MLGRFILREEGDNLAKTYEQNVDITWPCLRRTTPWQPGHIGFLTLQTGFLELKQASPSDFLRINMTLPLYVHSLTYS